MGASIGWPAAETSEATTLPLAAWSAAASSQLRARVAVWHGRGLPGRWPQARLQRTLTTGARQLVVHEAAVTMLSLAALYRCCGQG